MILRTGSYGKQGRRLRGTAEDGPQILRWERPMLSTPIFLTTYCISDKIRFNAMT